MPRKTVAVERALRLLGEDHLQLAPEQIKRIVRTLETPYRLKDEVQTGGEPTSKQLVSPSGLSVHNSFPVVVEQRFEGYIPRT